VRWSNAMCYSGPMSTSRVRQTSANGLAADPLWAVLASLHLHLKRQVNLQRVVEIGELAFSVF